MYNRELINNQGHFPWDVSPLANQNSREGLLRNQIMAIPPILVLIGRRQLPPEDFVVLDQSEPSTSLDYAINNNGGRAHPPSLILIG